MTYSLFKKGDLIAGQQHNFQFPGLMSLINDRIRSYVEEAYARSDLLDLLRALMKGWGKFVAGGMGEGSTRLN